MGKVLNINPFGRKSVDSLSDRELIESYQKKEDTKYIAVILKRYSNQITAMAYKYLKNEEEVKDLAGDLFLKLSDKLKKQDAGSILNFKAWLATVVKNTMYDQLRKKKTRSGHYESFGLMSERTDRPEAKQIKKLDEKHLYNAIDQLPDNEKQCLQMIFFEDKSYPEIMKLTGWSFNQARGYRDRSLKKLKGILGADFKDYLKDF